MRYRLLESVFSEKFSESGKVACVIGRRSTSISACGFVMTWMSSQRGCRHCALQDWAGWFQWKWAASNRRVVRSMGDVLAVCLDTQCHRRKGWGAPRRSVRLQLEWRRVGRGRQLGEGLQRREGRKTGRCLEGKPNVEGEAFGHGLAWRSADSVSKMPFVRCPGNRCGWCLVRRISTPRLRGRRGLPP